MGGDRLVFYSIWLPEAFFTIIRNLTFLSDIAMFGNIIPYTGRSEMSEKLLKVEIA